MKYCQVTRDIERYLDQDDTLTEAEAEELAEHERMLADYPEASGCFRTEENEEDLQRLVDDCQEAAK